MIYITLNKDKTIKSEHHFPFDEKYGLGKTEEELLLDGFFVDEIPSPEQIEGKSYILKANENNELYYEYVDRPLTNEEQLKQVKQKNEELESALMEMSFISAQLEQRDKEKEQAILELTTLIAGGNA